MVKEARREGAPDEGATPKQRDGSEGNQKVAAVTFRTERRERISLEDKVALRNSFHKHWQASSALCYLCQRNTVVLTGCHTKNKKKNKHPLS